MTLTDDRREHMIARLAKWIQDKGLQSPAILFLQANKPLAPISSQALLFVQPIVGLIGPMFGWFQNDQTLDEYALLLENPSNIEQLLSLLEQ